MKALISVTFAAAVLLSGAAFAEPISLSDKQMDGVTAGVGANNVAFAPWEALGSPPQNFTPNHLPQSDIGLVGNASGDHPAIGPLMGVAVPSAVPQS